MSGKNKRPAAAKYARANALVGSVLNKFHNGSARAVDPFVIRTLQEHEPRLLGIQCFVEQGPAENCRRDKNASHVINSTHAGGILGLFTVCGGFFGPGAAMRHWDACSESEGEGNVQEDAMNSYIAVVDKMLPGWDDPAPDHPVASSDRFWEDDTSATHCPQCRVPFSLRERRHHCRLCLAIFCAACCAQVLDVALCPGAPLRTQRVCRPCFQAAYRARKLREAKRISRENQDLEQQICAVLATAKQALAAKQQEEQELRALAIDAGCDLQALDDTIQKQHGGSPIDSAAMAMELPAPPAAHRFAPTQTSVESSNQLELAHRQLTMSFKMAQVRAHRLLDKMDATLAALREAVNVKSLLSSPRFELERLYGPGLPHLSLRCFQVIDFPISIVATGWFMTLFSNMEALSYDVAVRVFEGFIFKGWKQILQTALVILEELQKPILASSFDEIPRLFYDIQEYAPRLKDSEYVLTKSTNTVVKASHN
ncbi:hypothetical protein BBO99_00009187 [Phytophthora kernoviae]|uniref:FYVE-type domain-containing protein n=2 Tax=Phytophthora kernoviae TaxID=325452 RepID=A0A3R7GQR6_9STRA|nr:hypothetical protein G195_010791 [Phytophthora kernoviae 00238/432]KAG2506950.1 hypothetical protein JM16_009080 [Phytophthora kernoviae]KAG2508796.1 hypothetical protein JM18_008356 [Phytophthora kernoviae]RLN27091.1 hypothetical protein BBI17_002489 [Phytophthora kernoviae]RLN73885.1 hypothetical protein BBO99_00009187 [Phytophthora kernoviae]